MRMLECVGKHFSRFVENKVHARAWLTLLERTCKQWSFARAWISSLERTVNSWKSARCMSFTLDGRSTYARAWDSEPRSSVDSLARADCKTQELLDICISRSSIDFHARAECTYSEFTLERKVPRSSVDQISGNSRFDHQAQFRPLKHQTQFFGPKTLENT